MLVLAVVLVGKAVGAKPLATDNDEAMNARAEKLNLAIVSVKLCDVICINRIEITFVLCIQYSM